MANSTLIGTINDVTSQASTARDQAFAAFNLDASDEKGIAELAKKLDVPKNSQGKYNLQAVQMAAKQRFEEKTQGVTLFSAMLDKINQVRERIIAAIGR